MRIFVTVKARSRESKVVQIDETHFAIHVKAPPIDGRANEAVRDALAEHMDIAPSRLELVSGFNAKKKVFEVIAN